jgi:ADP-ribose pyrophosphatase YjhB (NUDIX family)
MAASAGSKALWRATQGTGRSAAREAGPMSEDARQVVGVAGVVFDGEGRILLIKTEKAGWELPGGRVEPGEDFIAALQREVREEARCEVEVGRLTSVTSHVAAPALTLLTFLCRHTGGDPCPGDDSLEAGWFAPDTAVRLVTHPAEQARLKDALGEDRGVSYRAYRRLPADGPQHDSYELVRFRRC